MFVQLQVNWIGARMQVDSARLKAKVDLLLNVTPFRACTRRRGGRHGGRSEPPSGARRQSCFGCWQSWFGLSVSETTAWLQKQAEIFGFPRVKVLRSHEIL